MQKNRTRDHVITTGCVDQTPGSRGNCKWPREYLKSFLELICDFSQAANHFDRDGSFYIMMMVIVGFFLAQGQLGKKSTKASTLAVLTNVRVEMVAALLLGLHLLLGHALAHQQEAQTVICRFWLLYHRSYESK